LVSWALLRLGRELIMLPGPPISTAGRPHGGVNGVGRQTGTDRRYEGKGRGGKDKPTV